MRPGTMTITAQAVGWFPSLTPFMAFGTGWKGSCTTAPPLAPPMCSSRVDLPTANAKPIGLEVLALRGSRCIYMYIIYLPQDRHKNPHSQQQDAHPPSHGRHLDAARGHLHVRLDDEKLTLELVRRTQIPQDEPISWMTFDHAKKNIYGAAMKKWSSFAVESPTSILHQTSQPMLHEPEASSPATNTRAIFLLAAKQPPYGVYCNPFYDHAGHGTVFAPSPSGTLQEPLQHYAYQPGSGIHGMVFDPSETYLYSADLKANKIWLHRRLKDRPFPQNASLELVGSVDCPDGRDHPRWVAMHPSGNYLYALMEKGNRICEYAIDPATHMPLYTDKQYPLIPPGIRHRWTMYRADVCALSHSGNYLFASSRANSFDLTGYIAAFKLGGNGAIERQICLNPTPTSGGHSNAVAPSDWCDDWVALTDDQEGWLEIYRWQDEFLARVARVRVQEPGFGMNAIWYD